MIPLLKWIPFRLIEDYQWDEWGLVISARKQSNKLVTYRELLEESDTMDLTAPLWPFSLSISHEHKFYYI